jgi:hypothetical protein
LVGSGCAALDLEVSCWTKKPDITGVVVTKLLLSFLNASLVDHTNFPVDSDRLIPSDAELLNFEPASDASKKQAEIPGIFQHFFAGCGPTLSFPGLKPKLKANLT